MKLNQTTEARSRKPEGGNPASQRGIALVLTLILLSVITFMAITFLAVSHREKDSVTTVTDTATARLAADAALAHAEAQAIANILATTNPYAFGLTVSTNYINGAGFQSGVVSPTNVNYSYANGTALSTPDLLINIGNLFYLPRAPVFTTNAGGASYYLDLNRNTNFDANGNVPEIGRNGGYIHPNGSEDLNPANVVTNFHVGDPEWIGVLERPDQPHGPNNPFIARYAFIAVPADGALDLNYIHNQTMTRQVDANPNAVVADGYFRNQGVGSWELNLAAFLADLNTNQWLPVLPPDNLYYAYNEPSGVNSGYAFEDAQALLSYRYNYNYNTLSTIRNLYGNIGANDFIEDNIDGYSDGALQVTLNTNEFFVADSPDLPWAGADNTNHFFATQELFDSTKSSTAFVNRLLSAGTNVSTYDRYTYYRLLAQLGVDSSPASEGKMNLNYRNVTNGVVASGMETNFYPWTAIEFFTNAADRMLRTYSQRWLDRGWFDDGSGSNYFVTTFNVTNAFGVTDIPVLVSNKFVYTPAVQRVLQLAANIYDATTTNKFPAVFRPLFSRDNNGFGTNLYISGYASVISVVDYDDSQLALPVDIATLIRTNIPGGVVNLPINVYGIPWIIGAKKGLPNFNEFSEENVVKITRKLQVMRNQTNTPSDYKTTIYTTNQQYIFSITNSFGFEFWNSYTDTYVPSSSKMTIVARNDLSMMLTNGQLQRFSRMLFGYTNTAVTSITPWPGWGNGALQGNSFISVAWNYPFLRESAYHFGAPTRFIPTVSNPAWETNLSPTVLPQFGLFTTNNIQAFILDGTNVIDYVHQGGPISVRNLNAELTNPDRNNPNGLWQTNLQGVFNQLNLSRGAMSPNQVPGEDGGKWAPPAGVPGQDNVPEMQAYFQGLFMLDNVGRSSSFNLSPSLKATVTNLVCGTFVQAPYTPTRVMVEFVSRQANDPLVHYLTSDMFYSGTSKGNSNQLETGIANEDSIALPAYPPNLGYVNDRYQPWGGKPLAQAGSDNNSTNLAYRDPLVRQSDNWDFPTNKLPGIGWLGRVHRGTPWQSVYLKASNILNQPFVAGSSGFTTWTNWTDDLNSFDATNIAPIQDRLIFDLFTTGFNDNATKGTLSVNQSGLAAWSALFSGVVVLSNNAVDFKIKNNPQSQTQPPAFTSTNIQPVGVDGVNSALWQLVNGVNGINQTRSNFVNIGGLKGSFSHVGDILGTPALTDQSPFLNRSSGTQLGNGISDEMYEWLPQQVMSLLSCPTSPRFVVYCYGQTLKPAKNGVYLSVGSNFGLVTNYQVTAEFATRAVVRIETTATNILGTNVLQNPHAVIENFNVLPPD